MSKYEMEFLEDDQRLRVSVPADVIREDSEEKFHRIGEISDAMRKAKVSNFFRADSIEELKKQVRIAQTRVSGLEKRNASTTEERKELKVAQDMLRIYEEVIERQKRIHEERAETQDPETCMLGRLEHMRARNTGSVLPIRFLPLRLVAENFNQQREVK
jgi:hypothetical protein